MHLTISDTDTSDTPSFADVGATAGDNNYGTFEMTAGTWTYTLDNNNAAVQALDVGETLNRYAYLYRHRWQYDNW